MGFPNTNDRIESLFGLYKLCRCSCPPVELFACRGRLFFALYSLRELMTTRSSVRFWKLVVCSKIISDSLLRELRLPVIASDRHRVRTKRGPEHCCLLDDRSMTGGFLTLADVSN